MKYRVQSNLNGETESGMSLRGGDICVLDEFCTRGGNNGKGQ